MAVGAPTVVDSEHLAPSLEPPPVDAAGRPESIRAVVVVKDPRITVLPHFVSPQECEHLLSLAEGYWIPSLVGEATRTSQEDYKTGNLENALSTTRTSWSCMLRYAQTAVVERLEHRLAAVAGLPLQQLERMNMVRYAPGELFDEHHDGEFRPITIFVYLNDLPEGDEAGDTFFPNLGLSFKPRRGTAVMWSNVLDGQEDSRLLHAGRAPSLGVKYGVNCFFNVRDMRLMTPVGPEYALQDAATVAVAELGAGSGGPEEGSPPVAYRLVRDPQVVAVPGLLSAHEAEALLRRLPRGAAGAPAGAGGGPFAGGTRALLQLAPADPCTAAIEDRIAGCAGLAPRLLGGLRVVRAGSQLGLCNRGCGPKSGYVCLGDRDEVFFVRLGVRLVLRRGDAVLWSNVDWETGSAVEDVRTLRVHVLGEGGPAVGLDVFFHDSAVREQQAQRAFAPDLAAATPQEDRAVAGALGDGVCSAGARKGPALAIP